MTQPVREAGAQAQAEAHGEAHVEPTVTGINHRKLGMWLFLASECMFFGSLIAVYLVYHGQSLAGPTPHDIFDIPLTTISTFVLLMSSLTMALSVHAIHRGRVRATRTWLIVTAVMGLTFLGFQAFEFNHFMHEGLYLGTSVFGSTFFVLTGFHGGHVFIGVLWLSVLIASAMRGNLGAKHALDVEIAGLYWHFVDIVWIVIFTVVYLIEFS